MALTDVDFEAVEAAILGRAPEHTPQPSLERTRMVCELLGDPQLAYPVVHVAGTNGKTSTSRMIDRLLREHGLRTGRFTSPHLAHVGERITVDGLRLHDERFVDAWRDVEPYVRLADDRSTAQGGPRLSFFEVLTCMAFAVFADAPVDIAVVEAGLGGTWDSTNVVEAAVSVVTSIELDHERWLGYTIPEIAAQKAGIIKAGAVVLLADQHAEAGEVLRARCAEVGATAIEEGHGFAVVARDLAVGGQRLTLRTPTGVVDDIFLPLYGAHQARNAALALAATEALLVGDSGRHLEPELIRDAFAHVDSPARLEVVARGPLTIVDTAHNPAGAAALARALPEAFPGARFVAVLGVMADKDAAGIVAAVAPVVSRIIVTESTSVRAMPVDDLAHVVQQVTPDTPMDVIPDVADALPIAAVQAAELDETALVAGAVLVVGSVYLAAQARTQLGAPDPDTIAVDTTRRPDDTAPSPSDQPGEADPGDDDDFTYDGADA